MKVLLIHCLIVLTLLPLVGCGSKENSVSLKVSTSFAMTAAGFSGGLVVSGKNSIGQRFVKTTFGGSSLNVVLPDGAWDLSVVGWDGVAPYSGDVYCGKSTINLASSDANKTVSVSKANCLTSDFSGGAYITIPPAAGVPAVIHPLRIVTCGSFYQHNAIGGINDIAGISAPSNYCTLPNHPLDLRSQTKSIKFIPIDKNFNGPFSSSTAVSSFCKTTSDGSVFHLTEKIPVSGLPIKIAFYKDSTCQDQNGFVLFPDGIKDGYSLKFDSLLKNNLSDNGGVAANQLFVSDNGINRGWSPFYHLMPAMICSGKFCGDFEAATTNPVKYNDAIFDYFLETKHPNNTSQSLVFPASSDICNTVNAPTTLSGTTPPANDLATPTCSYSVVNGIGRITVWVKPKTTCTSGLDSICSSPYNKFVLTVAGQEKEIYFSGKKNYNGSVQPVPFSHIPVGVAATTSTDCANVTMTTPTYSVGDVLTPIVSCLVSTLFTIDAKATLYAMPFYSTTLKTFQVGNYGVNALGTAEVNYGANYGSVAYTDSTNHSTNLLMLPPSDQEQKQLMTLLFESIGGIGIPDTFKNDGNFNQDSELKAFGALKQAREFLSTDGPSALFDHTGTCANTVGTKTITMMQQDGLHTMEITISNIAGVSYPDDKFKRPAAYCYDAVIGTPNDCLITAGENYGYFDKSMTIKKDGIPEQIMLFDCGSKRGRLESLNRDLRYGQYRREKKLMFWNTTNSLYSRFELYSREMESANSNFSNPTRNQRRFEKFHKADGGENKITGRIYSYELNNYISGGVSSPDTKVHAARISLSKGATDWEYSYSFYKLNDSPSNLFSTANPYAALKANTFPDADPHFCGTIFRFPLTYAYNTNCSSSGFTTTESPSVFGTFNSYNSVAPSSFDPLMNDVDNVFFPVSW